MKRNRPKNKPSRRRIPKKENIAAILRDDEKKQVTFVTKDMLTNEIYRNGPRVTVSFDTLARETVRECSEVIAMAQSMSVKHLFKVDDKGSEATCARLLYSATHSYVAAIQVARKGYPKEFAALIRIIVEVLATVLAIAIEGAPTLEKFQNDKLQTTKCIGIAKKALPFIGELNGLLSNRFVHIGAMHDTVDGARPYTRGDTRLQFVLSVMKFMAQLLDVVAELIYATEIESHRYWKREGKGWRFDPTEETWARMEKFTPEFTAP